MATNSHVADIYHLLGRLQVMANGQPTVYEVDRIWYHPAVLREADDKIVASTDPSVGEVYSECPDVAVLHLAGDAELPAELPLADWDEVKDLFAQPTAMLGFPSYDTDWLDKGGNIPEATYREGVISRQTDFSDSDSVPIQLLQRLAHTMGSYPGFSGSPIVLPNGHVIGLNNSGSARTEGSRTENLSYGIRIDCLWELLAYHGLDSKVAIPVDVASLNLDRFSQSSEAVEALATLNKARDLVAQATIDFGEHNYQSAMKAAKQASDVLLKFTPAYKMQAEIWEYYTLQPDVSDNAKLEFWISAEDCRHAVVILEPSVDNNLNWLRAQQTIKILKDGNALDDKINQALTDLAGIDSLDEVQTAELSWLQSRGAGRCQGHATDQRRDQRFSVSW